jgi:hypothetical protein
MRPVNTPAGQQCQACMFWDDEGAEEDAKPREGACCRFPPVRNLLPDDDETPSHRLWDYPTTGGHWWCGEFKKASGSEDA